MRLTSIDCHAFLPPASSGDRHADLLVVEWPLLIKGKGDLFFGCLLFHVNSSCSN